MNPPAGVSSLELVEAIMRNDAIYELAELIERPAGDHGGRPGLGAAHQLRDERLQRLLVPLAERRTQALPMVRQEDEAVRPRRVASRLLQRSRFPSQSDPRARSKTHYFSDHRRASWSRRPGRELSVLPHLRLRNVLVVSSKTHPLRRQRSERPR